MSARDAILQYLESNDHFTTDVLAAQTGLKRDTISYTARKMEKAGELQIKSRRNNWLVYRLPTHEEAKDQEQGRNTIFIECRRSPYMQRVLFMYGRNEGLGQCI